MRVYVFYGIIFYHTTITKHNTYRDLGMTDIVYCIAIFLVALSPVIISEVQIATMEYDR